MHQYRNVSAGAVVAAAAAVAAAPAGDPCAEPVGNCQAYSTTNAALSSGGEFGVAADDFTPALSGTITGVCFWGVYWPEPDVLPADDFTIRYYQDSGSGLPGTQLAEFTAGDLTVSGPADTGDIAAGVATIYEYSVAHPDVSVSTGTCYWVEISNDTSAKWYWSFNGGDGNGRSAHDDLPPDGYGPADARTNDLAFCLDAALGSSEVVCALNAACAAGAGPCDEPNATPGCADPVCCAVVCADDNLPFCCILPWDETCVSAAMDAGCFEQMPEACENDFNCQATNLASQGGGNGDTSFAVASDQAIDVVVADDFTPAVSGNVSSVCWWGLYFKFPPQPADCSEGAVDDFTITYYADDGAGVPGAELASFAVSPTVTGNGAHVGALTIQVFRYDATHADVPVTAGECYWIEIANNLDGTCVWLWETAPDTDAYSMQDFGDGWDLLDGENWDLSFCLNLPLEDPEACKPPDPQESCDPGDVVLTQNVDPDTIASGGSVGCNDQDMGDAILNLENFYARSYDLSAIPETAGQDVSVQCVRFGIEFNRGGAQTLHVNLYEDTNGGDPANPATDLTLLGTTDVLVPASVGASFVRADFDPPVDVAADAVLVVEVHAESRSMSNNGDLGLLFHGANAAGQTGPSYLRAQCSGLSDYRDLADIGFGNVHWLQQVTLRTAAEPCPWDCAEPSDGIVGITDFLTLLTQWQQVGVSCDLGLGEPGAGIEEFLALLQNWGTCP